VAKSKSGEHGRKHALNWLADELGVDRKVLARLFPDGGPRTNKEAFQALSGKYEREKNRDRRQAAEAETAEIEAAERRGTLMLTANHLRWVRELGTCTRAVIMESKLTDEHKKALCANISKIKIKQ
jgi:hypothetical protein